ncbi:MAG: alpha/beta hydrolase [Bacteroidales bacterium]|nr:alpha/beta hydrolase [Bacteroidales bacterium]MCF8454693.1 alpha/beta hydrolase [Bacteroidales bacterium]
MKHLFQKRFFSAILFFILILMAGRANSQQDTSNNSYYEGTIKTDMQDLLVWICILNENTDSLKATLDVPEQGVYDKSFDSISISGTTLWLNLKAFTAAYTGNFSEDKKTITGKWEQGGQKYDLVLSRLESKPKVNRPQEPKEPFPYRSQEVTFENTSAKIKLAGTLTIPENSWQAPAVILVSGSGPQNRNSELLGHKPFLVLSDYLTRHGIAVLRYDDRGNGESEGKFSTATTFDLAEDVMAAYEYLKNHKGINSKNIGIVGHSEGGLIAPIVASKLKDLAFIVLLAGPGTSGEQILYQQTRLISLAEGEDEKQIAKDLKFVSKIYAIAISDASYKEAVVQIRKLYKRKTRFMSKKKIKANNLGETFREMTIRQVLSPWFREFLKIDPAPYLQQVHCPVLAINGSKDLQVPPDPNLKKIEEILTKAGNKNVTTKEIEGVNHLFQHCETGSPTEYFKIEETFSEEVMKIIADWILKN